jgi:hypothetical protein
MSTNAPPDINIVRSQVDCQRGAVLLQYRTWIDQIFLQYTIWIDQILMQPI